MMILIKMGQLVADQESQSAFCFGAKAQTSIQGLLFDKNSIGCTAVARHAVGPPGKLNPGKAIPLPSAHLRQFLVYAPNQRLSRGCMDNKCPKNKSKNEACYFFHH